MRSKITSVARVAHVLLLRPVVGYRVYAGVQALRVDQIVRKRRVIDKKWTCVCLRLLVAAFTRKRRDTRFDLWPALYV